VVTPIYVALDFPELAPARAMAIRLADHVAGFKIGLELLCGVGPSAIEQVVEVGRPVFADAKLHDIPNTVGRASARIAAAGARWVSVHASGGADMMEAAVSGMGGSGVLAVTVLTSLDDRALAAIGIDTPVAGQVVRLARLADSAGVEGAVCSPAEAKQIKSDRPGLILFTPGVRPEGSAPHDQRRVATPMEAMSAGADYLVVGRPITRAPDPVAATREIASSMARIP
jgi:orotidine-5'-phosphate decarboxylase